MKTRCRIYLLTSAVLLLLVSSIYAETNLIQNPGFEIKNAKNGLPADWFCGQGVELSADSYAGNYSAKVTNGLSVGQYIPLKGQKELTLHGRVKTTGKVNGFSSYSMLDEKGQALPHAPGETYWSKSYKDQVDWALLTWTFSVPTNAAKMYLGFHTAGDGPGIVWVDEMELVEKKQIETMSEDMPEGAKQVFADDFSSGKISDAWKIINGKWEIINGALYGKGNAAIVCTNLIGRNMRVEYTAWAEGAPCDLSAILAIDPAAKDVISSGYFFGFGNDNNTKNKISRSGVELARTMMEGFSGGIVAGKKHKVVAQCLGEKLCLMVDDKVQVVTDDLSAIDIINDKFGFYIWSEGYIDDLKVYALPETRRSDLAWEVKPKVADHVGFDADKAKNQPDSMQVINGESGRVVVTNEPTWIYREDGEAYVDDPCAQIVSCGEKSIGISKSFAPISSGIAEFDLLAKEWGQDGSVKASLYDESGAEVFALVIEKDGTFWAETGKGREILANAIEYPHRRISTRFLFKPGRWHTLRMTFDAKAGVVRSIGVLNLYTKYKGTLTDITAEICQGEYFALGYGLPLKKESKNISKFGLAASGRTELLFDNLCILGPVGTRRVNGKNMFLPARTLMGLPFPPRKDPFEVKLYSLRNLAIKDSLKPQQGWEGLCGKSWFKVRDTNSVAYAKFRQYGAPRYNDLLVRQAYVTENCQLLKRSAYYLARSNFLEPAWSNRVSGTFTAADRATTLLNETYQAYAHAYVNNLDTNDLERIFTPAANALDLALQIAEHEIDGCLDTMPDNILAKPGEAKTPCPLPIETNYPTWKNGQWRQNGRPAYLFYGVFGDFFDPLNYQHGEQHLEESLRFSPRYGSMDLRNYFSGHGKYTTRDDSKQWLVFTKNPNEMINVYKHTIVGHCYSYFPKWWVDENTGDNDVFQSDEEGKRLKGALRDQGANYLVGMNIWNPKIRQCMQDGQGAMADSIASNVPGRVAFITLACEAINGFADGHETGHNSSAIEAFRRALADRYKSIEILNKTWGTNYPDFSVITPPQRTEPPSGLQYEFQKFRHQGFKDFVLLGRRAIQARLPNVPIQFDFQDFMGGASVGGFDMPSYFEMCDIVGFHMYTHRPYKASNRWLDSLRKVYGNTIGNHEWHAAMITPEISDEDIYKNSGLFQAFHRMMWGQGMSTIWDLGKEYDFTYSQCFSDPRLGYVLLRYFSTYASLMLDRARRLGGPALAAPSVQPEVGILEVTSSYYSAPIRDALRGGMCEAAMALEEKGINYGVFYEKLLLEGKQTLAGVQTLIVPNGICMPESMAEMLVQWVKEGGALIAYGALGAYDEYGKPGNKVLKAVFGEGIEWEHQAYNWWSPRSQPEIKPVETWGKIKVFRGTLGKGHVWVFNSVTDTEVMAAKTVEIVGNVTKRSFYCRNNRFDLVMRESGKTRYLYVLNSSLTKTAEDEIVIDRKVKTIVDDGLRRPMRVPFICDQGQTVFTLKLAPAEGTLITMD